MGESGYKQKVEVGGKWFIRCERRQAVEEYNASLPVGGGGFLALGARWGLRTLRPCYCKQRRNLAHHKPTLVLPDSSFGQFHSEHRQQQLFSPEDDLKVTTSSSAKSQ